MWFFSLPRSVVPLMLQLVENISSSPDWNQEPLVLDDLTKVTAPWQIGQKKRFQYLVVMNCMQRVLNVSLLPLAIVSNLISLFPCSYSAAAKYESTFTLCETFCLFIFLLNGIRGCECSTINAVAFLPPNQQVAWVLAVRTPLMSASFLALSRAWGGPFIF